MSQEPQNPGASGRSVSRAPLVSEDGDIFLKTTLVESFPKMAVLAFQFRDLIRIQLLTATEEFILRPSELFLGYSVNTFTKDPIVSLTISSAEIVLTFAEGIPAAGKGVLIAGKDAMSGSLRFTTVTTEDLMILKILVREAGRLARPKLPSGRSGHSFLLHESRSSQP